jgi:hypothetical protein
MGQFMQETFKFQEFEAIYEKIMLIITYSGNN